MTRTAPSALLQGMSKSETPEREDPTLERLQRDEPPPAPASLATLQLAQAAAHLCAEKKGEHVQILDVTGSCGYADVFVIASGLSERQTLAIAKSVDDSFRKGGVKPFSTEG
ncbi:MAG: RsfS/YbeB/iojap family protein, partial [Myxococcota bacterium]